MPRQLGFRFPSTRMEPPQWTTACASNGSARPGLAGSGSRRLARSLRVVAKQRELVGEDRVGRKLRRKFLEQHPSTIGLVLALIGEGQQNLRERLQVMAVVGSLLQLLDSVLAVAVNSSEPQKR